MLKSKQQKMTSLAFKLCLIIVLMACIAKPLGVFPFSALAWWEVLLPIYGPATIAFIILLVVFFVNLFVEWISKIEKWNRKRKQERFDRKNTNTNGYV
jgi:fumarate reductase subunit D